MDLRRSMSIVGVDGCSPVSVLSDRLRASFSELCGIDLWVLVNGDGVFVGWGGCVL